MTTTEKPNPPSREEMMDHLYIAWGVIANAGGWPNTGGASPGWLEAAQRWRDQWHELLDRDIADRRARGVLTEVKS